MLNLFCNARTADCNIDAPCPLTECDRSMLLEPLSPAFPSESGGSVTLIRVQLTMQTDDMLKLRLS